MAKVGEIIMKIITNIILAFLTIAVFIMAYSFFIVNIEKKDYVNYFGYTMFEVATGSMAKTINIDDLIIVKIDEPYKVGDIITYKSSDDYITHRVLAIDPYTKLITTKGDANNAEDNNVNESQVIGKVTKVIPKLGVWKKVVMTPKVLLLMFATLVLFNFAFSYNKKKHKDKGPALVNVEENKKGKKVIALNPKDLKKQMNFKKLFNKKHEKLPFRK